MYCAICIVQYAELVSGSSTALPARVSIMSVPQQLVSSSSAVWTCFQISPNQDGSAPEQANCRLCSKKVSLKQRNTTNLYRHLRVHHPKEYTACKLQGTGSSTN